MTVLPQRWFPAQVPGQSIGPIELVTDPAAPPSPTTETVRGAVSSSKVARQERSTPRVTTPSSPSGSRLSHQPSKTDPGGDRLELHDVAGLVERGAPRAAIEEVAVEPRLVSDHDSTPGAASVDVEPEALQDRHLGGRPERNRQALGAVDVGVGDRGGQGGGVAGRGRRARGELEAQVRALADRQVADRPHVARCRALVDLGREADRNERASDGSEVETDPEAHDVDRPGVGHGHGEARGSRGEDPRTAGEEHRAGRLGVQARRDRIREHHTLLPRPGLADRSAAHRLQAPCDAALVRRHGRVAGRGVRRGARVGQGVGPPVAAVRGQGLERAVTNLVANALKFTPPEGIVTIELSAETASDGSGWVELAVSDTGVGIEPGHLELVFQRYFQSGEIHQGGRVGTGIGLSGQGDRRAARGEVAAASRPGEGSRYAPDPPVEHRRESGGNGEWAV